MPTKKISKKNYHEIVKKEVVAKKIIHIFVVQEDIKYIL